MTEIRIARAHQMGLPQARQTARQWMAQAEEKFDLSCRYEEGPEADAVQFSRPGMSGTLQIGEAQFELQAQLGFMFSAFKDKIESEIRKNLDRLIDGESASAA